MLAYFVLADDFYIALAMTTGCSKLHLTNYFYEFQSFIKCFSNFFIQFAGTILYISLWLFSVVPNTFVLK